MAPAVDNVRAGALPHPPPWEHQEARVAQGVVTPNAPTEPVAVMIASAESEAFKSLRYGRFHLQLAGGDRMVKLQLPSV